MSESARPDRIRRAMRAWRQGYVGVYFQVALGAMAGAGCLYLLNHQPRTEVGLLALAGLAGTVGSSLAPLLRPLGGLSPYKTGPLLSSLVFAASGLGVGGAGYLLVRTLLVNPDATAEMNRLGIVVFGVLAGVVSGRMVAGFRRADSTPRGSSADDDLEDSRPAILSALEDLEARVLGAEANYDGTVYVGWYPSRSPGRTAGALRLRFIPRVTTDGRDDPAHKLLDESKEPATPTTTSKGRVLIQGGRDLPEVTFAVVVLPSQGDAYPSQLRVTAPVASPSPIAEFSIINMGDSDQATQPTVLADNTKAGSEEAREQTALIDITQQGRTIQLLEVRLPPGTKTSASH